MVYTPRGPIPIQDIKIGEVVYAADAQLIPSISRGPGGGKGKLPARLEERIVQAPVSAIFKNGPRQI